MPLVGLERLLLALLTAEAVAAAFLLLAWLLAAVVRRFPARTPYPEATQNRAGQRFHRELVRRRSQTAVLVATLLVLPPVAVAEWLLLPAAVPFELPWWGKWVLVVQQAVVLGGFGRIAWCVLAGYLAARRAWHANLAVGHLLQRFALAGHRVFHDVTVAGLLVDHMLLGPRGVFLVNVVVRRPRRKQKDLSARIHAVERQLEVGGVREFEPVFAATRRVTETGRWLENQVGRKLRPVSAIVVPGWDTVPTVDGEHLLFNTTNLGSLSSWAKPEHGLLDEDLNAVNLALLELCHDPRPV